MTLHIDISPQTEAWINAEAQQRGLLPGDLVRRVLDERARIGSTVQLSTNLDTLNPTIALLQSWIAEDFTDDPAEIRKAEEELVEFKRNMNAPRKEVGARLLFPEVE